jgi:hypothetical protein
LEATLGELAALQNHLFYNLNGNIWALEGASGDLSGAKVAVNAGLGEVDGESGARNKPKRKRGGAEHEKRRTEKGQEAIPLITPGPPLAGM